MKRYRLLMFAVAALAFSGTGTSAQAAQTCELLASDRPAPQEGGTQSSDLVPELVADSAVYQTSLAVSPDGNVIAAGYDDGMINLWNATSGDLVRRIQAHDAQVGALAFSPDGCRLASGSVDRRIRLWRLMDPGSVPRTLTAHDHVINAVGFSPDGEILASTSVDGTVRFWQEGDDAPYHTIPIGKGSLNGDIAFSPDGRLFALTDSRSLVSVVGVGWDFPGYTIQIANQGQPNTVAFNSDSSLLAIGTVNGDIRILDALSGDLQRLISGGEPAVGNIAFSADGDFIARGSDSPDVKIWRVADGSMFRTVTTPADNTVAIAFTGVTGELIIASSTNRAISSWNFSKSEQLLRIQMLANTPRSVQFSADGRRIVVGYHDGAVGLLTAGEGVQVARFAAHSGPVTDIALSADGKRFATSSEDGWVGIWSLETGRSVRRIRVMDTEGMGGLLSIALAGKDRVLAAGGREVPIELRRTSDLGLVTRLGGDQLGWTFSLLADPDGDWLADGGDRGKLRLWDTDNWQLSTAIDLEAGIITDMALSVVTRQLAAATYEGSVLLLDTRTWERLGDFDLGDNSVNALAFTSEGESVIAGMNSGDVQIRDVRDKSSGGTAARFGALTAKLSGHTKRIGALSPSPDGKTLVTVSADKTLRLWDLDTGRELWRFVDYGDAGNARVSDGRLWISSSALASQIWLKDGNGAYHGLQDGLGAAESDEP